MRHVTQPSYKVISFRENISNGEHGYRGIQETGNIVTGEHESGEYRCRGTYTPFTLALLIRSETGFAPMRAFTLHQLIRINDLIRIKLNHLLEVVSHRFSLLRVLIASVDATGTRIKAEQI